MRCLITFDSISSQRPASFSLVLRSNVHDSQAYRDTDMTRESISFIFDPRAMMLSLHIGFSFLRVAVDCESLRDSPVLSFHLKQLLYGT